MTASPEYHIDDVDIFRLSFLYLAPGLPYYKERVEEYIESVFKTNPQVMIIQGLSPDEYTLMAKLRTKGTLVVGEYRKTIGEKAPSINATWVAQNIPIPEQRTIRISELSKDGITEHVLAPDCIVTTLRHRGHTIDLYNMENVQGIFNEKARTSAIGIMNRDAYLTKTRRKGHLDSLLMFAGNMHAEPTAQSVRYIRGLDTIQGYAPSGWRDVWDELKMSKSSEQSATQNMGAVGMFCDDVIFPQFMRGKRMSYFFVYSDVFGRVGTPILIDRNGTDETGSGLLMSDSYGLDMGIYLPAANRFARDESD